MRTSGSWSSPGRGRAFCAGADVGYMADLLERGAYDEANLLVTAGRRVIRSIIEMPKPVIAALNGAAAGGGANMALACDLRIASDRAAIGQTFNRIGLAPDWGGSWLVPRLVGRAKAAELFFLADMVDAEEAERIGLVNRVVPHAELEDTVREVADRLAAKPALALALAKEALRRSLSADLDEMLDFEVRAQDEAFRSRGRSRRHAGLHGKARAAISAPMGVKSDDQYESGAARDAGRPGRDPVAVGPLHPGPPGQSGVSQHASGLGPDPARRVREPHPW